MDIFSIFVENIFNYEKNSFIYCFMLNFGELFK